MKKIALISLFVICACCAVVKAQYIVTKVAGKVKNEAGDYVRPGTELKSDAKLSWSSQNDKLWVVIVGKGEKIITPTPQAAAPNNVLTQVLIASLHQSSTSAALSGRGEIIEKIPDALRTDPKSNGKVIIEQENKYNFDPAIYPQGNAGVFFVEIDVPQQTPIIRTLKTVGDTLYINYADLVTEITDPAIRYSIGYHNKTAAGRDQLVISFDPYFDMTSEMEDMIANTVLAYQNVNNNKDAVRDSVYRNIYASSGKPNGILFTDLYNKYWLSKGLVTNIPQNGGTGNVYDEQAFLSVPKLSASVAVSRDELPANFSLRQYAPPVGYQGQYGSCTAWSTAYAARTIAYAVQHNYSISNHYDLIKSYSFAPDFIYNNIRLTADCNSGSSMPSALNFMMAKGNIIKVGDFICGKTYNTIDLTGASNYRIKDFQRVNDGAMGKENLVQKMKSLLTSKHALPFGMHVPNTFMHVASSGIWYPTAEDRASAMRVKNHQEAYVGHAMCVIGYNDAINNGSFEVMNSWGTWNGNLGFYWISYDDFYAFANEVYSIVDFEAPAPVIEPVKTIEKPVVIVPVAPKPKQDVAPKVVVAVNPKPQLRGSLEFMLLKPDNSFESIPVNKKQVGTRGQTVESDNDPQSYANFVLSKSFHSGDKYKIKFNIGEPTYVYVIGMDKQSNYTLFPQKSKNESALISLKNATLYLPDAVEHYTLDNVTGKEKMCILVSKSPITIDDLNKQYAANDHNLYQAVRTSLNKRLLEMTAVNYSANSISFNTEVNDDSVLAFFIEMDHL